MSFADKQAEYNLPREKSDGEDERKPCPEDFASFPSKITYWWFTGLAYTGWKKALVVSDLWDLRQDDKTCGIGPIFERNWQKGYPKETVGQNSGPSDISVSYKGDKADITSKKKPQTKKQPGVVMTLIRTFGCFFLSGSFCKLLYDLLAFTNPQLLK